MDLYDHNKLQSINIHDSEIHDDWMLTYDDYINDQTYSYTGALKSIPPNIVSSFLPCKLDENYCSKLVNITKSVDLNTVAANNHHFNKMQNALNKIAYIEQLSTEHFNSQPAFNQVKASEVFGLYNYSFPNEDERFPAEKIEQQIRDWKKRGLQNDGSFYCLAYVAEKGMVVGYSQGGILKTSEKLFHYMEYCCVADNDYMQTRYNEDFNPRAHGILNLIYGANIAILLAAEKGKKKSCGSIWEAEPLGIGNNDATIQFSKKRLKIYNRVGGRVLIGKTATGELINFHIQPKLSANTKPIVLHMFHRPLQYEEGDQNKKDNLFSVDTVREISAAYIDYYRVRGIDANDIKFAEDEVNRRLDLCTEIVLLPTEELPDAITLAENDLILKQQLIDIYGVKNLDEARQFYNNAMLNM